MRPEVLRVLEFAQRADSISRLDVLTQTLAEVLRPFGVTSVSANLIVTPGRIVRPGILLALSCLDGARGSRAVFGGALVVGAVMSSAFSRELKFAGPDVVR